PHSLASPPTGRAGPSPWGRVGRVPPSAGCLATGPASGGSLLPRAEGAFDACAGPCNGFPPENPPGLRSSFFRAEGRFLVRPGRGILREGRFDERVPGRHPAR